MKVSSVLAIAASLLLASTVLAQEPAGAKPKPAPRAAARQPIVKPAADLKWTDLDPTGAPGVKVADLWGDHTKGAFGALPQASRGIRRSPSHAHPRDEGRVRVGHVYPGARGQSRRCVLVRAPT